MTFGNANLFSSLEVWRFRGSEAQRFRGLEGWRFSLIGTKTLNR